MMFITDIQMAWNQGKVTSALTFDIKGYFNFFNHKRLLYELRRKHIPIEYVKWTKSFLTDREVVVCIDGKVGSKKPVQNGIPQGSPVSPILAAFYSAELIELFAPRLPP
jgi:retron-type reverse transcriptase